MEEGKQRPMSKQRSNRSRNQPLTQAYSTSALSKLHPNKLPRPPKFNPAATINLGNLPQTTTNESPKAFSRVRGNSRLKRKLILIDQTPSLPLIEPSHLPIALSRSDSLKGSLRGLAEINQSTSLVSHGPSKGNASLF